MKRSLLFLVFTLFIISCKKHNSWSNDLPPTTQDGANTFGFLLNGTPWIPSGFNGGQSNLAVDIDTGYSNGVFGITSYRETNNVSPVFFNIGISDSLNFLTVPINLSLDTTSLFRIYYSDITCTIFSTDTSICESGKLTITKLDKNAGIVSGTFDAILFLKNCGDTIKITEGRFDMKF